MDPQLPEPEPLVSLIEALRRLPGVGVRSARRMTYHLMQHDLQGADMLGRALAGAVQNLRHCARCNSFTEDEICSTCANPKRDPSLLCIVETPADQNMIESSHGYRGLYYVLMGRISPLDGQGPTQLGLDKLLQRVDDGVVEEVILATNYTNEGEATAHYLSELLKARGIKVSRIARGIPVGGELEYVDPGTLAQALRERRGVER